MGSEEGVHDLPELALLLAGSLVEGSMIAGVPAFRVSFRAII